MTSAREILIVDDEVGIRELLSEILQDEGYRVSLAENATEARSYRQKQQPALVLLDIWMPDTDGVTLLREWAASGQLTLRQPQLAAVVAVPHILGRRRRPTGVRGLDRHHEVVRRAERGGANPQSQDAQARARLTIEEKIGDFLLVLRGQSKEPMHDGGALECLAGTEAVDPCRVGGEVHTANCRAPCNPREQEQSGREHQRGGPP